MVKTISPVLMPFTPSVFVDITDFIDIKKQVMEAYSEEMRQPPHTRSIENAIRQNALRGNTVGIAFAEAYQMVRYVR